MNRMLSFTYCLLSSIVIMSCGAKEVLDDVDNSPDMSHYLIVFGDIQQYTYGSWIEYYKSSVDWITQQIDNNVDICAVLELGDVTENNKESQWKSFRENTEDLANRVPFFVCTGNHDYEWNSLKIKDRNSTLINQYAHFKKADECIVDYYQDTSLENYVAQLSIGSRLIKLLVLEFGPREEVVNWARDYVQNHPNDRFILMTHEWLSAKGERMSTGTTAKLQFEGYSSYSTPEDVWNKLVKDHNNIVCVICGHEMNFSCMYSTQNSCGREVPQLLFNLQFQPHGGDGVVQIWKISDSENGFNICAFDTINKNWFLPDSTSYYIPFFE